MKGADETVDRVRDLFALGRRRRPPYWPGRDDDDDDPPPCPAVIAPRPRVPRCGAEVELEAA